MKKLVVALLCLLSVFSLVGSVNAAENEDKKVMVYIFTKLGCPHCEESKTYFSELSQDEEYGDMIQVKYLQVWGSDWTNVNTKNQTIMNSVAADLGAPTPDGAPFIIVGTKYYSGFSEEQMDEDIKKEIKRAYEDSKYKDPVAKYLKEPNNVVNTIVLFSILGILIAGGTALVVMSRKANKK